MYNLLILLMTSSTQILLSKYNGKKSEDINIHIKVQLTFHIKLLITESGTQTKIITYITLQIRTEIRKFF